MPKPDVVFTVAMEESSDDEIEYIPYEKPQPEVIDLLESEEEVEDDDDGKKAKKKSKKKKSKKDKNRDKENVKDSEVNDASLEIDNPVVSLTSAEKEQNEGSPQVSNRNRNDINGSIPSQVGDSRREKPSSESGNVARNDSVIALSGTETEVLSAEEPPQVNLTSLSGGVDEPGSRFEKCNDARSKQATGLNQSVTTGEDMIGTGTVRPTPTAPVAPVNDSPAPKRTRTRERKSGGGGTPRTRACSAAQQRTNEEIATFLTTLGIPLEPSVFDTPPSRKRQARKRKQPAEAETEVNPTNDGTPATTTPTKSKNAFISVSHESSPTSKKAKEGRKKRSAIDGDITNFNISFTKEDLNSIQTNIQSNIFIPGDDDSNSREAIEKGRGSFIAVSSSNADRSNMEMIIDAVARGESDLLAQPLSGVPETGEQASKGNGAESEHPVSVESSEKANKETPTAEVTVSTPVEVSSPSASVSTAITASSSNEVTIAESLASHESSSKSYLKGPSPPSGKRKRQAIDGDIANFQISTCAPAPAKDQLSGAVSADIYDFVDDDDDVAKSSSTAMSPSLHPTPEVVKATKKPREEETAANSKKTKQEDPIHSVSSIQPIPSLMSIPTSPWSSSESPSIPTSTPSFEEMAMVPYQGQIPTPQANNRLNEEDACFPITWTPHMKEFYGAPKNVDFEIDDVWYRLPGNRRLWETPNDLMPPPKSKRNYIRCAKCRQFGHFAKECREKTKPHICHMCGNEGHTSDFHSVSRRPAKCPYTRCLNCGQHLGQYSQQCLNCLLQRNPRRCDICNVIGHNKNICPDLWRRYHSVTTLEEYDKVMAHTEVSPLKSYRNTGSNKDREIYKRNSSVYCCNCGRRGHTYYICDENRSNPYHRNKPFAILEIPPSILASSSTDTSGFMVPYDVLSSRSIVMNAVCDEGPGEGVMEIETIRVQITNELALKTPVSEETKKDGSSSSAKPKDAETRIEVEDKANVILPCKGHPNCTNKLKPNEECFQVIIMRQCHVKLLRAQENGELKAFEKKHDVQISVINEQCKVHFCGKNAAQAEKDLFRFLWKDRRASTENQQEKKNVKEDASKDVPVLTIDDEDDCVIVEVPTTSSKALPSSPSKGSSAIANLANAKRQAEQSSSRKMDLEENFAFDDDTPLPTTSGIYTSFDQNLMTGIPQSSTSSKTSLLHYESPLSGLSLGNDQDRQADGVDIVAHDSFCVQKESGVSSFPSPPETPKETSHSVSTKKSTPATPAASAARENNDRDALTPKTSRRDSPSTPTSTPPVSQSSSSKEKEAEPELLVFTIRNDKMATPKDAEDTSTKTSKSPSPPTPKEDDADLEIIEIPVTQKPSSDIEVITLEDDEDDPAVPARTPSSSSNRASKSSQPNKITLLESEWKLVSDELLKRDSVFTEISKFFCVTLDASKESSSIFVTEGSVKKRQMAKDNVVFWLECQSSKTPYTFLPRGYEEIRKAQKRALKHGKKNPNFGNKNPNSIIARASRRSLQKMKNRALKLMDVQTGDVRVDKKKKRKKRPKNKSPNSNSDSANQTPVGTANPSSSLTPTPVAIAGSSTSAPIFLPLPTSTPQKHTWSPGFNNNDFRGRRESNSTPSKRTAKGYPCPSPKKMKANKNKSASLNTPTSGDKPRKKRYFHNFDNVHS